MTLMLRNFLGVAALFACATNAHISLTQPVPYGKPDTSPLNPDGSNYPCKTENGFKINSVTELAAGQSNPMTFSGSASHGGGSCQISLAKGYQPNANTQFKVVTSIEGACPGGGDGNSGTEPQTYTIPKEVASGEYTLAWTWFNKIGNREMYMNCAPIKVTGGASGDTGFNALPDMAIYNIASKNTCKTDEGSSVQFPNPGANLQTKAGPLKAPSNCGGAASAAPAPAPATGGTGTGTGTGNTGSGTGTGSANTGQYTGIGAGAGNNKPPTASRAPPAASPSASAPSAAAPAPAPAASGSGTFAEGSANGTTGSVSSAAPAAPAPAASSSAAGSGVIGKTPGSNCGPDGSLVCSDDGTQFGLCNWGKVMFQAVASGTKCSGGQILRRHSFLA